MDLGLPEIIVVLLVVLLLFGPSKVPQLGESLGKAIRGFRDAMNGRGEQAHEAPRDGAAPTLSPVRPRTTTSGPLQDTHPGEPVAPDSPQAR